MSSHSYITAQIRHHLVYGDFLFLLPKTEHPQHLACSILPMFETWIWRVCLFGGPQPPVCLNLCTPGQPGRIGAQERMASDLLEEVCIPLKQRAKDSVRSAEPHPGASPRYSPTWGGCCPPQISGGHPVGAQDLGLTGQPLCQKSPLRFLPFKATSPVLVVCLPLPLSPTLYGVFYFSHSDFQPQVFSASGSLCKHFPNWFSLTITPVPRNSEEPSRNLPLSPKVHLVPVKDSPDFLLFSESLSQPVSKLGRPPLRVVMSPGFVSCSCVLAGVGRAPRACTCGGSASVALGQDFFLPLLTQLLLQPCPQSAISSSRGIYDHRFQHQRRVPHVVRGTLIPRTLGCSH